MFKYKKHNPYVMHGQYTAEELAEKIEQSQALFSAS